MKNILKSAFVTLIVSTLIVSCSPNDNYSMSGDYFTENMITFTLTPGSNEFTFNYNVSVNHPNPIGVARAEISFNDGGDVRRGVSGGALEGNYEIAGLAGTYTATVRIHTPNGTFTKTQTATLANDNLVRPLTTRTLRLGVWSAVRRLSSVSTSNWGMTNAATNDDRFTFAANGAFTHNIGSAGTTYMHESLYSLYPDGLSFTPFITSHYTPPTDAAWEIVKQDNNVYLVITKGFLAFATQPRDLEKTAFQLRLSEREFNYNRIRMRMVDPETFEPIVVTAANLGSAGANSGGWFFELLP